MVSKKESKAVARRQGLSGDDRNIGRTRPATDVSSLSWRDFERLMAEAFRRRGFAITGFGSDRADGGVDLGLMKQGERFLVQCRHWRKPLLGLAEIGRLITMIAAQGARGGFVVTAGQITREARALAQSQSCKIELIDGSALGTLIGAAKLEVPYRSAG